MEVRKRCAAAAAEEKKFTLTLLVHVRAETFPQPTGATLIPMRFINGTLAMQLALRLAGIHTIAMNRPLKKSAATCKQIF